MSKPKIIIHIERKKKDYLGEERLRRLATGLDDFAFNVKTVDGIMTEDKD